MFQSIWGIVLRKNRFSAEYFKHLSNGLLYDPNRHIVSLDAPNIRVSFVDMRV